MSKAKTLNKAELKRVLNYNDAHELYRERNRAMIQLTHLCGMRIGEIVNLKVYDVDPTPLFIPDLGFSFHNS